METSRRAEEMRTTWDTKKKVKNVGNTFRIIERGGKLVIQGPMYKNSNFYYTNKLINFYQNLVGYCLMLTILQNVNNNLSFTS